MESRQRRQQEIGENAKRQVGLRNIEIIKLRLDYRLLDLWISKPKNFFTKIDAYCKVFDIS